MSEGPDIHTRVRGTVIHHVPRTTVLSGRSSSRRIASIIAAVVALAPLSAFSLDFTAGSGAAYDCASRSPQLQAAAVAYLQPAPLSTVDDYGADHYAPDQGRNIGVAVGFAELSVGLGAYCVGVLYRSEFEGDGSRDLLDILRGNHNGVTFDAGRAYSLTYETETLRATGLRVRRSFNVGYIGSFNVRIGIGLSALKAIDARWESMTGSLTASTAEYASGTATWLRTGTEVSSFNPFVTGGNPKGLGYSSDLHVRATSAQGTAIDVIAMDLYGRIHWRNVRDSLRTLDNVALRYDANANREAFVHGFDKLVDTVQSIPTKYRLAISQPVFKEWSLLAADDLVRGDHFVALGVQYGADGHSIAASYDVRTQAVGITAHWGMFVASAISDRWNWRDASTLGLTLQIATRW